jgi:hypothetical protein
MKIVRIGNVFSTAEPQVSHTIHQPKIKEVTNVGVSNNDCMSCFGPKFQDISLAGLGEKSFL